MRDRAVPNIHSWKDSILSDLLSCDSMSLAIFWDMSMEGFVLFLSRGFSLSVVCRELKLSGTVTASVSGSLVMR